MPGNQDRSPSLEPFLDTNRINEYSEGIRIEQMLIEDPDEEDEDNRSRDTTDPSATVRPFSRNDAEA